MLLYWNPVSTKPGPICFELFGGGEEECNIREAQNVPLSSLATAFCRGCL